MSFGGGGGTPAPQPLPVAPAVDPVQVAAQQKADEEETNAVNARGRAASILTSPLGADQSPSNVAVKTLGGV